MAMAIFGKHKCEGSRTQVNRMRKNYRPTVHPDLNAGPLGSHPTLIFLREPVGPNFTVQIHILCRIVWSQQGITIKPNLGYL